MDTRSEQNLIHVHPDLAAVIRKAARDCQFIVIHGLRTEDEEKAMVAKGASETMHSRHLPNADGLACAVDVACLDEGHITWEPPAYSAMWAAVQSAAEGLKIPVEWGGDWRMRDLGHVQLSWKEYP